MLSFRNIISRSKYYVHIKMEQTQTKTEGSILAKKVNIGTQSERQVERRFLFTQENIPTIFYEKR